MVSLVSLNRFQEMISWLEYLTYSVSDIGHICFFTISPLPRIKTYKWQLVGLK